MIEIEIDENEKKPRVEMLKIDGRLASIAREREVPNRVIEVEVEEKEAHEFAKTEYERLSVTENTRPQLHVVVVELRRDEMFVE